MGYPLKKNRQDAAAPQDADAAGSSRGALRGADGIASAPAFDRLIHERMRLSLLSALAVNDVMSFNELKQVLDTTDGNLSVHARKLEEAEYVRCTKSFHERLPRTEFRITQKGRTALEQYLSHMEALIKAVRDS